MCDDVIVQSAIEFRHNSGHRPKQLSRCPDVRRFKQLWSQEETLEARRSYSCEQSKDCLAVRKPRLLCRIDLAPSSKADAMSIKNKILAWHPRPHRRAKSEHLLHLMYATTLIVLSLTYKIAIVDAIGRHMSSSRNQIQQSDSRQLTHDLKQQLNDQHLHFETSGRRTQSTLLEQDFKNENGTPNGDNRQEGVWLLQQAVAPKQPKTHSLQSHPALVFSPVMSHSNSMQS